MGSHWLCMAVCRPGDPPQTLYPDIRQTAKDRSEIILTPEDGTVTGFGPVSCSTHRRSPEGGWVNTRHFDQTDAFQGLVTDQRLVLSCRNYVLAKQRMRFGLVAIALSDKDRSWDSSLMAGHVLWRWVVALAARSPVLAKPGAPYASEGPSVRLTVQRPDHLGASTFLVEMGIPSNIDYRAIARDIASRVVRERLSRRTELTEEQRQALTAAANEPSLNSTPTCTTTLYSFPHALQVS